MNPFEMIIHQMLFTLFRSSSLCTISSLFRYGLDKKDLYIELCQAGNAKLYNKENYNNWLTFVLDPRNAKVLGEDYENPRCIDVSFIVSILKTFLIYPYKFFDLFKEFADPVAVLKKQSIVDHVIKNEQLNDDLKEFAVNIRPDLFYQDKTILFRIQKSEYFDLKAESLEKV